MSSSRELGRAAGRLAGKWLPVAKRAGKAATKDWEPLAKQSGLFVKHVVPATIKPVHSLWHEIIGFVFLVFAGTAAFKLWQHPGVLPPLQLVLVGLFVIVMAGYGISSIRKARKISRS